MYHIQRQNQEKFSTLSQSISTSYGINKEFHQDPIAAIDKLKGFKRKIALFFFDRRNLSCLYYKNSTIARELGCCERTVQRCTADLCRDGILSKFRENKYAPNQFSLHTNSGNSFRSFVGSLSGEAKKLWESHGVLPIASRNKNVVQIKSYIRSSYISLEMSQSLTCAHAHARARTVLPMVSDSGTGENRKEREKTKKIFQTGRMKMRENLKREELNFSSKTLSSPELAKEKKPFDRLAFERFNRMSSGLALLRKRKKLDDEVCKVLLSPAIVECMGFLNGRSFRLHDCEIAKLLVFPEHIVQRGANLLRDLFSKKIPLVRPIDDLVGWFVAYLVKECKGAGIQPDWRYSFEVCKILGINAARRGRVARKVSMDYSAPKIKKTSSLNENKEYNKAQVASEELKNENKKEKIMPMNSSLDFSLATKIILVQHEISVIETHLSDPNKYYVPMFFQESVDRETIQLGELKKDLNNLRAQLPPPETYEEQQYI